MLPMEITRGDPSSSSTGTGFIKNVKGTLKRAVTLPSLGWGTPSIPYAPLGRVPPPPPPPPPPSIELIKASEIEETWMSASTRFGLPPPERMIEISVSRSSMSSVYIYEVFKTSLKKRESIDAAMETLKSKAKIRGFGMLAGQGLGLLTLFVPFVKQQFFDFITKTVGLVIYLMVMLFVIVLISLSLKHLMAEYAVLESERQELIRDTNIRLHEFFLVSTDPAGPVQAKTVQELSIKDKLEVIAKKVDLGFLGDKLVWVEMGFTSLFFTVIPIIATYVAEIS